MAGLGPTFPLVPRRPVAGRPFGTMPSSRRGPGWDLAGSRPYRPGDDVRRVDWRATARLSSARDGAELVVREHAAEQASGVVLAVDRRPSMGLFPPDLPWLRKPAVVAEASRVVAESALRARCPVGRLEVGEPPSWSPPGRAERGGPSEEALRARGLDAPEHALADSLSHLAGVERLPPASFVFVLSDFLAPVPDDVWSALLARRFDVVPVVIQDPVWEQSFPDVAGAVLDVADPGGGGAGLVRLDRRGVAERRRANEERLAALGDRFRALGVDWVLLSREDPRSVVDAFRSWADARRTAALRLT